MNTLTAIPPIRGSRALGRLIEALIVLQPFGYVAVMVSIITGAPPLWLSWLLFLGPFGLRWLRREPIVAATPFDLPVVLLVAGLCLGIAVSPDLPVSIDALQTYAASILVYYMVICGSMTRKWYLTFWAYASFAFVLTFAINVFARTGPGIRVLPFNQWLYSLGGGLSLDIYNGPGFNALGTMAGLDVAIFAGLAVYGAPWAPRGVSVTLAALSAFILLMSGSTAGIATAAAGIGMLLLFWRPWTLGIIIPGALVALWWLVSVWHPASPLAPLLPVDTFAERLTYWNKTLALLQPHPLAGLGLGTWFEVYNPLPWSTMSNPGPHNAFLQLYSDTGLPGGLALLAATVIFIAMAWHLWPAKARLSSRVGLGMAVALVAGCAGFAMNSLFESHLTAFIGMYGDKGAMLSYRSLAVPLLSCLLGFFVVSYRMSGLPLPRWLAGFAIFKRDKSGDGAD